MMTSGRHLLAALVVVSLLSASRAQSDLESPEEGGFSVLPGCGTQKMDLMLVIDTSENEAAFKEFQDFASDIIRFANPDTGLVRVGVVAYSSEVNHRIRLSDYSRTADLVSAVESLKFQPGRRDTSGGLQSMRQLFRETLGDRPDAPNVALLLTSGNSVLRTEEVSKEARLAHDADINVFVVGVGVQDEREINDIVSSPTDETKYLVDSTDDLEWMPDVVFNQMCIRLQSQVVNVLRASNRVDLAFLLHFSNEMTEESLEKIKGFMKNMISKANIDSGDVRVGAAVYRRRAFPMFRLNQYDTKAAVHSGIDSININYRSASASAAAGLDVVRSNMFTVDNGDRADVPNVVIVLTDANSDVDVANTISAAQQLRETGATVFAIGVNLDYKDELEAIASSRGMTYVLTSFDELERARDHIVRHISGLEGKMTNGLLDEVPGALTADKSVKLDVAVVFHTSNTVSLKDVNKALKPFLVNLFKDTEMDSGQLQVSLGYFSKNYKVLGNLQKYKSKAAYADAVLKLPRNIRGKKSNGAVALKKIGRQLFKKKKGDRPDASNVVILLTDGKTNVKPADFPKEAETLRENGVKIVTVGVDKADENELKSVATQGQNTFMARTYDDLANAELTEQLRDAMFTPLPRPPPEKEAVLTLPPATSLAVEDTPTTKTAPTTPAADSNKVDVAVVFHVQSGTKVAEITKSLKPFLKNIFKHADIDGGNVRVALSYFRKNPTLMFNLQKTKTKAAFTKEVDKIKKNVRGKKNDAGKGLKEVRTTIFDESRGDRTDVPNAVILITDNKVNLNPQDLQSEASALKAAGVKVITVGIEKANEAELRTTATDAEDAFYFDNFAALRSDATAEGIRQRIYALQEDATPPPPVTKVARKSLRESDQADLVFAIHFNPSASNDDFRRLTRWIQGLVRSSDVDSGNVRIAFYVDDQYMPFQLNSLTSAEQITESLDRLSRQVARSRRFNLVSTLSTVRERMFTPSNGDRPDVPNGLVIITDTTSSDDRRRVQQETARLAQEGISVYTVGVGLSDKGEMETVASSPRNVFAVSDYRELETNVHSLRSEIKAFGAAEEVTTRAPAPTRAPKPSSIDCNDTVVDMAFVIDSSTSVTELNLLIIKDFIMDFLFNTIIDGGNVRVDIVTFSNDDYLQFRLNEYTDKLSLFRTIDEIPHRYGSTNTADALNTMRTEMFTEDNGDRPDVPNMAIVLPDGVSTINSRRTIPGAEKVKAKGIHIYAIGIAWQSWMQ